MPLLSLTRKRGESVFIGGVVKVTVFAAGPGKVRLGIEAPAEVVILRDELPAARELQKKLAIRISLWSDHF